MNRKGLSNILLIVAIMAAFAAGGYFFLTSKSENQSQVTQEAQKQGRSISSRLTDDLLRNSEYTYGGQRVKLIDGRAPLKPQINDEQSEHYILYTGTTVFGDLNEDDAEDAVVVLSGNFGKNGPFRDLVVVINQNGIPTDSAHLELSETIEIAHMAIESGTIQLLTAQEPSCGDIFHYRFQNNKLIQDQKVGRYCNG